MRRVWRGVRTRRRGGSDWTSAVSFDGTTRSKVYYCGVWDWSTACCQRKFKVGVGNFFIAFMTSKFEHTAAKFADRVFGNRETSRAEKTFLSFNIASSISHFPRLYISASLVICTSIHSLYPSRNLISSQAMFQVDLEAGSHPPLEPSDNELLGREMRVFEDIERFFLGGGAILPDFIRSPR